MADAKAQVKYHRHIMKIDNLDKNQRELLERIDNLYELFPDKDSLSAQELKTYIKSRNPQRDVKFINDLVDSAMAQDIGSEITQTLIEGVVEQHMSAKVAAIVAPVIANESRGDFIKLYDVLSEYEDLIDLNKRPDTLVDCDMTFEEAITYRATDSGIKWPLDILNKCIGGVEPSLGLVIARPDTGKTSFLLNCLAYFAYQIHTTGRQLLYCGNEEGIIGLKARAGVALLGCETEWAEQNPRDFGYQVSQKGGDCIRFHGGVRSTRDVETLIKRYEPVVVVADQIGKFKLPVKQEEGPAGLAAVYGWFREASDKYGTMVMGVAQADIKGHNIEWLNMNHINASKTDVPGELDWGVGIGMLYEAGMEYIRFINIFKNKMKYGRKGRGQVNFNPDKCRYTD